MADLFASGYEFLPVLRKEKKSVRMKKRKEEKEKGEKDLVEVYK